MKIQQIDFSKADLVIDLFNRYRIFYKQKSDIKIAKEFIQNRLNKNESIIFVAFDEESNQPIGFTQLYPIYSSVRAVKNWLLNDLFVDESFRKKGVGESLIKTAMNFAKSDGAIYLELSTAIDNLTAQKLYERIGFIKLAPETGFYTYQIQIQ